MNQPTSLICRNISNQVFNLVDLFRNLWLEQNHCVPHMQANVEERIRNLADDLIAWRFAQYQTELDL